MSRHNTMVFQNMRPPVAAEKGNTPLRGKNAKQIFALASGDYEDRSGYRVTKEQVVLNYTDDARLVDSVWDQRHHVTPSGFNVKNHKYYKQYFGKDFKNKDHVMLHPHRQLDPYEENEVKGTRMPDYTKLAQERDIYGELGWIQNFNVKNSKNNDKLYPTYREFFDGPQNYHNKFNNQTMTNSEFFRQNAPRTSVARITRQKRRSVGAPSNFSPNSSVGFKSFATRRGHSVMDQSKFGGSQYDTPFVLEKEPGNKFKVVGEVEKTVGVSSEIPFLRTQIDPQQFAKTYQNGFGHYQTGRSFSNVKERKKAKEVRRMARKEFGWNNYIKPISKYNSSVHPSMRIPFEQI